MKTSLDYLPENKQAELKQVIDLIVQIMEPEMVILYGSYARNDWTEHRYEEDGIRYEYKSDFDILVISRVALGPNRQSKWRKLEKQVRELPIETPVQMIHEGIKDMNGEILKNSYFYVDILKEGVLLYDTKNVELASPRKLNEEEQRLKAKEDFEQWYKTATMFFEDFENNFEKGQDDKDYYKNAAFQLHQATERYFTALLLVFTGYREKTHDVEKLNSMAIHIHEKFKIVFPLTTPEEKNRFDLLKRAYIDARYKKDYSISKEDLEYLSKRVEVLRELVKVVCEERVGRG